MARDFFKSALTHGVLKFQFARIWPRSLSSNIVKKFRFRITNNINYICQQLRCSLHRTRNASLVQMPKYAPERCNQPAHPMMTPQTLNGLDSLSLSCFMPRSGLHVSPIMIIEALLPSQRFDTNMGIYFCPRTFPQLSRDPRPVAVLLFLVFMRI